MPRLLSYSTSSCDLLGPIRLVFASLCNTCSSVNTQPFSRPPFHPFRKLSTITEILEHQQPSCPQLFVYSTSDLVIPVAAVESFAAGQRKSGRPVSLLRFECSPHVDHLRTFPRTYQDRMFEFVSRCLGK